MTQSIHSAPHPACPVSTIDPFSDAFLGSPYGFHEELRDIAPVFWLDRYDVYGMARHGVVHPEFLVENNGEGLGVFARAEPHLAAIRQATTPRAWRNAEWVARETETGRGMMESFRARTAKALAGK